MSTLRCTITLDKTSGLVLLVEDAEAQTKRTVTLSKDSLVLEVQAGSSTSTVTQNAVSVSIECKKFSVKAEEIECSSTKASTYAAGTALSLSGKDEAKLSGRRLECSGTTLKLDAKGELTASASGVTTVKGQSVAVSAMQVDLG